MPQFHLRIDIPDDPPYDRHNWDWQAIGEIVLPFIVRHSPPRWWLGRYYSTKVPKHLLIRYESFSQANELDFPWPPSEHTTFDIVSALGSGRFLGPNARTTAKERANTCFDLLTSASELALQRLSHKQDGYWVLEESADTNNGYRDPFESVLHLFANAAAVTATVAAVNQAQATQLGVAPLLAPSRAEAMGLIVPGTPIYPVQF